MLAIRESGEWERTYLRLIKARLSLDRLVSSGTWAACAGSERWSGDVPCAPRTRFPLPTSSRSCPPAMISRPSTRRDCSSRANFTYLDRNNICIQDDATVDYITRHRDAFGEGESKRCCHEHALPEEFEGIDYEGFLAKRRVLMAQLVKDGLEKTQTPRALQSIQ